MKYLHRPQSSSGFSLVEVMVSIAVLAIVASVMATAFKNNLQVTSSAKSRSDVGAIEQSFRSQVFSTLSQWAEAETPAACAAPQDSLVAAFAPLDTGTLSMNFSLNQGTSELMSTAMRRRCSQSQTTATNGVYLCFELNPPPSARSDEFLKRYRVFAEAYFGFWNAGLNAAASCSSIMSDVPDSIRGAKLFYTLSWIPIRKDSKGDGDGSAVVEKVGGKSIYSVSGYMYSPTH